MRNLIFVAALTISGAAQAADGETQQQWAIDCLSRMETETSWSECRKGLFAPCAGESVGGEAHLSCLSTQKKEWREHLNDQTIVLNRKLTEEGSKQLTDLLGSWFGYVSNKCSAVAKDKADISANAALLGCEISEFAGLSTEFHSCLGGNSVSPYCTLKE